MNRLISSYDQIKISSYDQVKISSYDQVKISSYDQVKISSYDQVKISSYDQVKISSNDQVKIYYDHYGIFLGLLMPSYWKVWDDLELWNQMYEKPGKVWNTWEPGME